MNRLLLLFISVLIGLSAQANYTVSTYQPFYPTYAQQYNQSTTQQYNQDCYQNPQQAQCQQQYVNPYQYQNQYYGYGNNLPYAINNISGLNSSTVPRQIVRNIGQRMIYSMMRGY